MKACIPNFGTLLNLGIIATVAAPAEAAVRRVPSEYATINQALDACVVADSVLVAPGVYDQYETRLLGDGSWYSSVVFLRGGVPVISEAGATLTTLRMDATQTSPRVVKAFGETGIAVLQGFTVTGTVPTLAGMDFGFGDRCVVRDCVFRDIGTGGVGGYALGGVKFDLEVYGCRFENINAGFGSALGQTSGTLLIEDSEFLNCRQGAMRLTADDSFPHAMGLTVRRCRFVGNVSNSSSGAISGGYPDVLIEDSWFEGNESGSTGAVSAGGVNTNRIIRRCTFVSNAGVTAGALRATGWTNLVEGNTFWGNHIDHHQSSTASAVVLGGNPVFRNNVIVNSTGDAAVLAGPNIQTGCNVYWDNPLGNTSGFQPDSTDLQADPLFCDELAKDFHVNAASPCIPGNGHPACTALIGAWDAACGVVSVESWSWGRIKSGFRSGSEEAKR